MFNMASFDRKKPGKGTEGPRKIIRLPTEKDRSKEYVEPTLEEMTRQMEGCERVACIMGDPFPTRGFEDKPLLISRYYNMSDIFPYFKRFPPWIFVMTREELEWVDVACVAQKIGKDIRIDLLHKNKLLQRLDIAIPVGKRSSWTLTDASKRYLEDFKQPKSL